MQLFHGNCLDLLPKIPDKSVDCIIADLPYGTTYCAWDTPIPFEPLWHEYKRIIKPKGAILLNASQPFTSALVMSQPKWFRYEWIWEKYYATGFLDCRYRPLKAHESILVFARGRTTYNPQMVAGKPYNAHSGKVGQAVTGDPKILYEGAVRTNNVTGDRYPRSIQKFHIGKDRGLHPTQKPVSLCEYLIKTYTNPGELVLDNCMGSGSTGVAAANTGRDFMGIELDKTYFDIAANRLGQIGQ